MYVLTKRNGQLVAASSSIPRLIDLCEDEDKLKDIDIDVTSRSEYIKRADDRLSKDGYKIRQVKVV